MLTQHHYITLPADWDERASILKCCKQKDNDVPTGADCCYDQWVEELKQVNQRYKRAEEQSKQKATELAYVTERRDSFKKWFDELTKLDELQKDLCHQLAIIFCQAQKVGTNTQYTVDAIKILFCMIRDYYLQLDKLNEKYEQLMECIKCLQSPVLTPGEGLMKLIADFGTKLQAARASHEDLIKKIMEALSLAEKIDLNIGQKNEWGLYTVISEWETTLNCHQKCIPNDNDQSKQVQQHSRQEIKSANDDAGYIDNCELRPILKFPICNARYYKQIQTWYSDEKNCAEELTGDLHELNKCKESLLACKQSLDLAIKEVDPKTRCK